MGFNTGDPRWQAWRRERLGRKFRSGETKCPYCGTEMWFTDFERIQNWHARTGEKIDGPNAHRKDRVATLDHIIPLSNGGIHHQANLTAMCQRCNKEKGAQDPLEWIQARREAGIVSRDRARKFRKAVRAAQRLAANFAKRRNRATEGSSNDRQDQDRNRGDAVPDGRSGEADLPGVSPDGKAEPH